MRIIYIIALGIAIMMITAVFDIFTKSIGILIDFFTSKSGYTIPFNIQTLIIIIIASLVALLGSIILFYYIPTIIEGEGI